MRTTLDIADDVLSAARALAAAEGRSLGQVVSRLARKGMTSTARVHDDGGLPRFTVPEDAAPLTPDAVRRAMDE